MVFSLRKIPLDDEDVERGFSVSDWDNAPTEPVTSEAGDTASDSSSGQQRFHGEGGGIIAAENTPQMNLGSIMDSIQGGSNNDATRYIADSVGRSVASIQEDDLQAQVDCSSEGGNNRHPPSAQHQRRKTSIGNGVTKKLFGNRSAANSSCGDTVAASSSASRTSYSSSTGTNIWTKLLGGSDALWDTSGKDAYDDSDEYQDDDQSFSSQDLGGNHRLKTCRNSMRSIGLSLWYESRHFVKTAVHHPHILFLSLVAFGAICGVGMAAINAEKERYIQKQQGTAGFVAQETADWFANEFRRAMMPLYSIQQGVVHSGYFDSLADEIGPYPQGLIAETAGTPSEMRNVSGICDQADMIDNWNSIVEPANSDNNLDGVVVGYRLAPNNVACVTEPNPFPASDKSGFDAGHSDNPFWKTVTTDLFIKKEFNIFGPFPAGPYEEMFCGHLAVWNKPAVDGVAEKSLDVHGTEVEGAWGFVMNFLDWKKLKEKSDIYSRFSDCKLDFILTRESGPTIEGKDSALLAKSDNFNLLDDSNSIVVETESLMGTWQNRVGSINGWEPAWYTPAVIGVVLTAVILSLLTASTLVERQLHRNLLYKVMPRRAIAKLHRGQTVIEKFNLVTIFFSDIVGFTSMSGKMRPIQIMKMLNELYTELDRLVAKHQVYKVETIGDAYMVVGGAPDRVPAPLAAERVALFSQEAIDFVKHFRTKDGDQIFMRAGLASGPTVAGVVGNAMPRYCFFGDTVNFASRMESTSKKMRIQVAEITYRLLQDSPNMNFELEKRMEDGVAGVEVKGKGHLITYWLNNSSARENIAQKVIEP